MIFLYSVTAPPVVLPELESSYAVAASIGRFQNDKYRCLTSETHLKIPPTFHTLTYDKRNSRGISGQSMIRRTCSSINDRSCTFSFTVRWDHIGFYISLQKKKRLSHALFPSTILQSKVFVYNERETLELLLHVVVLGLWGVCFI